MQVWPAFRNLPKVIQSAACPRSASGPTMTGDLPPSSSVTEARVFAAAAITIRPTAGEPVKKIWSKGRASSASATALSP